MPAEPAIVDHPMPPDPRDHDGTRLLGLVRKLIDYGRGIIATLQGRNTPTPPLDIARRFGSLNLALIIARITRGLMIATALQERLRRRPARGVGQIRPTAPARAARAPRMPDRDEDAELLGNLPSAREIAARIRNRPAGAVIIDICRDLGIDTTHPLWRDIQTAVIRFGGNLVNMLRVWQQRLPGLVPVAQLPLPLAAAPPLDQPLPACTHPP
jgi:hypothetical protein